MTTPPSPPAPLASPAPPAPPAWGAAPRRSGLSGAVRDAFSVVLTGLRLLGRHFPALVVVFLAGVVLHELAMRGAVRASEVNSAVGLLVLLFAPMALLASLVLMLRVVRPSLPFLGRPVAGRRPSVIHYLASMLAPFIAIYYFEKYVNDDLLDYANRIAQDEAEQAIVQISENLATGVEAEVVSDPVSRLPLEPTPALAAVFVAALVGRWVLNRWGATHRNPWLGLPGAYLELVWFAIAMLAVIQAQGWFFDWFGDLRAIRSAEDAWHEVTLFTGVDLLANIDKLLIIPIAWLAIGALALGYQAAPAPAADGRGHELYHRAERRWLAVPRATQWLARTATSGLRDTFAPLFRGVRLAFHAGVVPILVFCLAFVTARAVQYWLWELERFLIGPQDVNGVWFPLAWPLTQVNRAVSHALLICLVAAAVDRAVARQAAARSTPTSGPSTPSASAGRAMVPPAMAPPAMAPPAMAPPAVAPPSAPGAAGAPAPPRGSAAVPAGGPHAGGSSGNRT